MPIKKLKHNPGMLYVMPAVIAIAAVMIIPLIYTILLGFNKSDIYSDAWKFVGLAQFQELFQNAEFLGSIQHTFVWTFGSVVFQFLIGFLAAVLISQDFIKFKGLIRLLLMIPWVLPSVISVSIWKWLYHPDFGYLNHFLKMIGLTTESINWVSDERYAMISAVIVNVWKMFPLVMLMIEASLQSVPNELKEAASVDGAKPIRIFFTITVPHVSSTCYTIVLLLIIWTLNAFTFIFALTGGGPANSTQILSMYIYKLAFQNYDFGMAGAASTVLFVITAALSIFYMKFIMKGERR
ncbi:sugar ABC transporter permease [Paenibacillus sp. WQ 127069]|uniref:Sugar ABC transporter permease n=1 Tax=Paenibacillus baimaensis TaxID=2982185 RepID=A0ABT2UAX3_9BACL|nr:sugar ABC transporter permease [Paenibacillus sp. WQ 127069]MCU6791789.1 sugar ABC transporter permease [Paenibacillus sp. WQ 127069]